MWRLLVLTIALGGCLHETDEDTQTGLVEYEYTVPDCPHDRNPTLVCINAPECFWICSAT